MRALADAAIAARDFVDGIDLIEEIVDAEDEAQDRLLRSFGVGTLVLLCASALERFAIESANEVSGTRGLSFQKPSHDKVFSCFRFIGKAGYDIQLDELSEPWKSVRELVRARNSFIHDFIDETPMDEFLGEDPWQKIDQWKNEPFLSLDQFDRLFESTIAAVWEIEMQISGELR